MDTDISTQEDKSEAITGQRREPLPTKDPIHEVRTTGEPIAVDV
jgi:hypothetical protein